MNYAILFIFIVSLLSTISGIGGGPLFLPIFLLYYNLSLYDSVPLVVLCIFISCLIRTIYYLISTNNIHFTITLLTIPFILSSHFIGLLLGEYISDDYNIIFIYFLLIIILINTLNKAFKLRKKKEKDIVRSFIINKKIILMYCHLLITTFLLIFFNELYITIIHSILLFSGGIIYYNIIYNIKKKKLIILMAFITGIFSTYLSIGGGILLTPILLSIMTPKTFVATASFIATINTLIAIIRYIINGRLLINYIYTPIFITSLGTILGLMIVTKIQKQYYIIFILSFVIFISLCCILYKTFFYN